MNLTKEDTEKATYRNKMKEIEKEAKLLKERLHKIWDLKQIIKLIKLEKVLEERRRQQINIIKYIKNLEKLEVTQDQQMKVKESKRQIY